MQRPQQTANQDEQKILTPTNVHEAHVAMCWIAHY